MIPEIGHFALVLALSVAVVQGTLPLLGAWRGRNEWMAMAAPAAQAQLLLVALAYAVLTAAFVGHDFSVAYVAQNSNLDLPLMYRISAVWGAHEGSLLLWSLVIAVWTVAVSATAGRLPEVFRARVLAVMGLVAVGFLLFMIATSNPFERLLPAPGQGRDLNPLLQDPGMAIHPPLLYMGYVGLVVPFAFAVAALLGGRVDPAWTRWIRPWTTAAWVFLTLGIAIGSWWAYTVLGWGGWWFWDPVENASFIPWLVATALIHSLAVTEQRGAFRAWTVLLALTGFSLSLLGTFLVRSGVLVSVHAFATDPTRGAFILVFLLLVVGGALALYAWRATSVSGGGAFDLLSRETLLLVNNVLLAAAAATVLLGTLYPLFLDALGLGKISVGPPYFNTVFVPLMLPLLLALGVGPMLRWKSDRAADVVQRLAVSMAVTLALAVALWTLVESATLGVVVALALAGWVLLSTLQGFVRRLRHRRAGGAGLGTLPRSFVGMSIAHAGVAIFVVGVTLVSAWSVERDVRMAPGVDAEIGEYRFELRSLVSVEGPNYAAERAEVVVRREGRVLATLYPEKRYFHSQPGQPMTEPAVVAGWHRDLFIALGEPLGGNAWAVRLQYRPFQRWIWAGALIMALGGIIALSDRRYRSRAVVTRRPPAPEPALSPAELRT